MKYLLLQFIIFSVLATTNMAFAQSDAGEKDDPEARAAWELLRLRDPATGKIPDDVRAKELSFAAKLPSRESLIQKGALKSTMSLNWNKRGPYNVGGRTRALAINVGSVNVMMAGGVSGGLWRTADAGASWTKITSPSDLQSVTCIAQDTRSGHWDTWYYGTGEYAGNSASYPSERYLGDGLFKSTDHGVTWSLLPSTTVHRPEVFDSPFDYVWNVAVDPSNLNQDVVYAAVYGGIKRSTDGGATWSFARGSWSGTVSRCTDVAVTSTGVVYATLSQWGDPGSTSPGRGIWRSSDGVFWTDIKPSGWPQYYTLVTIGIAPSNENIVYFLAETPGTGRDHPYGCDNHGNCAHNWTSLWRYRYISGDGSGSGGQWQNLSANLPSDFHTQGDYDILVKVKPDDTNAVFIGGTNIYRSTDGFATSAHTQQIGGYHTANHHSDQHAIVFRTGTPSVMFTGSDGGVHKTNNCMASPVVWTSCNNGYNTSQFYTIAIDHATSGNDIIIGGLQDNDIWFTNSPNPVQPWVFITGGDGGSCAIADGRSYYYVSFCGGWTARDVIDGSGHVSDWVRIDPTGGDQYGWVNPMVLDPNDSKIMYFAGGHYVWRNSDLTGITYTDPASQGSTKSTNWARLNNTNAGGAFLSALAVSKNPANRLYYGTDYGHVFSVDGANSGDPTPLPRTGSNFPGSGYISCIAVDPTDADKAMVVFSNYGIPSLFYTTNGGSDWADVSGTLEQNPDGSGNGPSCRWATIVPGRSPKYLVGTSTGLYSTDWLNGGSTRWVLEGASTIGNTVVDMLDARRSDGLVVAATHGNGVYSTKLNSFMPTILTDISGVAHLIVRYGSPRLTDLTIHNNGTGGSPVRIRGTDPRFFVTPDSAYIPPDGTAKFTLKFLPDSLGPFHGTIVVESDSPTSPDSIEVNGLGVSSAFYADSIHRLASVRVDKSLTDSVWITNTTENTMHIGSVSTSNQDFTVIPDTGEVPPFGQMKFYILFHPTVLGDDSGTIFFAHDLENDPGEIRVIGLSEGMTTDIYPVYSRWNMVSVPLEVSDARTTTLFPMAKSKAFKYNGIYQSDTSLLNGVGYWIKFGQVDSVPIVGFPLVVDTVEVREGWNMIGSISATISVKDVEEIPSGIVTSSFFGYSVRYDLSSSIEPVHAYWVKVSQDGKLVLKVPPVLQAGIDNDSILGGYSSLLFNDAQRNEGKLYFGLPRGTLLERTPIPPMPPASVLDVRFSSERLIEVQSQSSPSRDIPIVLTSAMYPVEIQWSMLAASVGAELLIDEREVPLTAGHGAITLDVPPAQLRLRLGSPGILTRPTTFALEQNHPNPFNPLTSIDYQLPVDSRVTLRVYNILGQIIATLADGIQQTGFRSVEWNTGMITSGVYYYRLEATSVADPSRTFTSVRKMVLVR